MKTFFHRALFFCMLTGVSAMHSLFKNAKFPIVSLRTKAEFEQLRQNGKTLNAKICLCSALPNNLNSLRVGLITSRSYGNAVQRNRARRILRAALFHLSSELQPGFDLVLIARPALQSATSLLVVAALRPVLKKLGLLSLAPTSDQRLAGVS